MCCELREYVEGECLSDIAGQRKIEMARNFRDGEVFSPEEIIHVGCGLCDQLSVLHGQHPPIIHRDIKPQNVVIRTDGTAVLIDFEISRTQKEKHPDTIILGTQGFAPPEQYGFRQTDARSDIYSLGALLDWMRNGGEEHIKKPEDPLEKVISRCKAFDPDQRYPDAESVTQALLAAAPGTKRRKWRRTAAAGVLLLALLACLGLLTHMKKTVTFQETLLEQAVRMSLGLKETDPLTEKKLAEVTGVYVVSDRVCADRDTFYSSVNQWYAEGRPDGGSISVLEDLTRLPGLEEVCLAAQRITDLSPLAELEHLNKVEVKHNDIEDISPLAGMTHLISVGINDNPVTDISPLLKCPSLAFLDLCDVRNYDVSLIGALGNFDFLDISNPTDSWRYLSGKSILSLRLAWTGITDLSLLE